jgi:hypothetical protein
MRDVANDIFIYKLSPSGIFLWGNDGLQLSSNADFEANPVMAVQPDASVVVAWPRSPDTGDATVILQRLSKNGGKRWNPDVIAGETGFDYTWPRVLPLSNRKTMLICYKEWGPYWAPNRSIIAQVYDSLGNPLWNPKPVLFTGATPVYVHPLIAADGLGGAYVCWFYERIANHLSTFVQHVDHNGIVTMATNGIEASTKASTLHLEPAIACDTISHDLYVFWRETDNNQNVYGLCGQKVSMEGTVAWGTTGKMFIPLSSQNVILLSVTAMNGSTVVAYLYGGTTNQTVKAIRVDSLGNTVWTGGIKDVSTAQSGKGYLASGPFMNDQFIFSWSDNRLGGEQIFAQNLNENGNPGPLDYSFSVSQDTLYFLDPQAFIDGRSFYIRNPHDYPLDIQYIQQSGEPYPPIYLLWYTVPHYDTFPVTIPPHDSILETVRWIVIDAMPLATTIVYDTLDITSLTEAHPVIIAADSLYITISTNDRHLQDFFAGPNPFTNQVKISWNVSRGDLITLTVFNTLMQPVRTIFSGQCSGGNQEFTWDGMNENHQRVSPGVYLIRLQTSSGQSILRVIAL